MNKPTEMTEMIERIAKALEPKLRGFGQGDMPMAIARELARAAMEAMLDPTDAMLQYGCQKASAYLPEWEVAKIWRGMIHAALGKFYKSPE